ncbi:3-hydroxyisobutyrate dehydrogenase [Gloeomargarita lithophora Alchichica-D10]|uniref:3-hydroxyisobutyrate dehydrogenase n=1 Tax=Gloeomargarita lithophora Alchichica-D10 TaxID=1188229 RepID=A0A1J0AB46_9CYAN|nr:NAD(P)-dependent oxidoreductase [Gloeomargarita lithophora]APB33160.1 3-hydroxyisobutyrate dehydrogenase [Gloeomargarita lithophora Alchichica-D10]
MNKKTVAVIGLGAMGSRIAQNLLSAGYAVVVHNRTVERAQPLIDQGAIFATSPRAAAEQSNVVISMVTDNEVSRQVWLAAETGAILGLSPDKIAIEMSTLTVDWIRELDAAITQWGAGFLDAPVVGSRPQAEAGKLISLVGGQTETLAKVQTILTDAGAAIVQHIGAVGQGMAMKLAVNAFFGIQVVALAELLGLLSGDGISPETAMDCLRELPVLSLAAKGAGSLMASQNHAPLFPIHLVEKDFRYVTQTAQDWGATIPISTAVIEIYRTAIAQGYAKDNITGIVQLFV